MAFAFQHKLFSEINKNLTKDMTSFVRFCKEWRLVPNLTKTVASCFHLNNQAAKTELEVMFDGIKLRHEFEPVYLGVRLDRSLTYRKHSEKLTAKLRTRNNLLQKLACTYILGGSSSLLENNWVSFGILLCRILLFDLAK